MGVKYKHEAGGVPVSTDIVDAKAVVKLCVQNNKQVQQHSDHYQIEVILECGISHTAR